MAKLYYLSTILCFFLMLGCSQPSNNSQDLTIVLPDASHFATKMIKRPSNLSPSKLAAQKLSGANTTSFKHVVLNVKQGESLRIIHWDACNGDREEDAGTESGECAQSSANVAIAVPNLKTGENVQLQVLAVLENEQTDSIGFIYDETETLVSDGMSVRLSPSPVAFTSQPKMANLVGRFMPVANQGPTGKLEILYQPPSGKDPMMIESSSMVNGWFRTFLISGIRFVYQVRTVNGEVFPLGEITPDSAVLSPSNHVLRLMAPETYYEVRTSTHSPPESDEEGEEQIIYAFLGPGVVNQNVCFTESVLTLETINGSDTNGLYSDSSGTNPLVWDPAVADITAGKIGRQGGVALSSCTGTEFVDYVVFDPGRFLGRGTDGGIGFRSVFQAILDGHWKFLTTNFNANIIDVNWNPLPGTAQSISGYDLFALPHLDHSVIDTLYRSGRGCTMVKNNENGIVDLARTADLSAAATSGQLDVSASIGALQGSGYGLAMVCPFVISSGEKRYLEFEMESVHVGGGQGPGNTTGTGDGFIVLQAGSPPMPIPANLPNTVFNFLVGHLSQGAPAPTAETVTLEVQNITDSLPVSIDVGCDGPTTADVTTSPPISLSATGISSMGGCVDFSGLVGKNIQFLLKNSSAQVVYDHTFPVVDMTASWPPVPNTGGSPKIMIAEDLDIANNKFLELPPNKSGCVQFYVAMALDGTYTTYGSSVSASVTSATGLAIHDSFDCTGPTGPSINISPGQTHAGPYSIDLGSGNHDFLMLVNNTFAGAEVAPKNHTFNLPLTDSLFPSIAVFLQPSNLHNDLNDRSPNSNDPTVYGDTTSANNTFFGDQSIVFDGSGDRLEIAHHPSLVQSGDYTIDFWVKSGEGSTPSSGYIFAKNSALSNGMFMKIESGGTLRYRAKIGITTEDVVSTTVVPHQSWMHVRVELCGSSLRMFINGTLESSQSVSGNLNIGSSPLNIGADYTNGTFFNGYLQSFRFTQGGRSCGQSSITPIFGLAPITN